MVHHSGRATRRRAVLRTAKGLPISRRRRTRIASAGAPSSGLASNAAEVAPELCPICLAPLEKSSSQTLSCSHVFHTDCVQELRRHRSTGSCPVCRQPQAELQSVQELKLKAARAMARYGESLPLRSAELENYLRQILELMPSDGHAHYCLGHVLLQKGDFAGAVTEYRTAVQEDTQLAQNLEVLGEVTNMLETLGDHPGALQIAQEIAQHMVPTCADSRQSLAEVWYDLGELDNAIAEFQAALRFSTEQGPRTADIHGSLGMVLFDKGDVDGAVNEYRAALVCDPFNAYAHANLGNAMYQQGSLSDAIKQYRRALRCDPNDGDVSCNLGDALYEKGKLQRAIRVYEAAVSRNPDHVTVRCKLANARFDVWDFRGAINEYQEVLARDPNHWEAFYNLRYTKRRLRKLRQM